MRGLYAIVGVDAQGAGARGRRHPRREPRGITNVRDDGVVTDRVTLIKGDAIVMTHPDGAEQLESGAAIDIAWASPRGAGSEHTVVIEWSSDGGDRWLPVASAARDAGTFRWRLPDVATTRALVRVRRDDGLGDESNGTFRVAPK